MCKLGKGIPSLPPSPPLLDRACSVVRARMEGKAVTDSLRWPPLSLGASHHPATEEAAFFLQIPCPGTRWPCVLAISLGGSFATESDAESSILGTVQNKLTPHQGVKFSSGPLGPVSYWDCFQSHRSRTRAMGVLGTVLLPPLLSLNSLV